MEIGSVLSNALIMTLRYLTFVLPVMAAGIFLMNLAQNRGLINKISWITAPLVKFGHFKDEVGMTFLTAFGSPSASNAMLKKLYEAKTISGKELQLAVFVNAFPVMVMESRTMLPAMLSFMSFTGALLFGILVLFRLVQTFIVLLLSRFLLEEKSCDSCYTSENSEVMRGRELIYKSLSDSVPPLRRMILISAPVTFLAMVLVSSGFFTGVTKYISGLAAYFPVPAEGLGVVVAYFGHYIAGYTLAGSLLAQNVLSVKEIIITLLSAKVLASVSFALRHSAHYYVGIFGGRMGLRILVLNLLLRNAVNISGIALLYYFW